MKLTTKVLVGLGLLAGVFIAARRFLDGLGSVVGNISADVEEWFDEHAPEILASYQQAGNAEVIGYWRGRKATAEDVAQAVRAGLTLPVYGLMTFPRGYQYLANTYMNTTVDQAYGGSTSMLDDAWRWFTSSSWGGSAGSDKVWDIADFGGAKSWATTQLELYTSWGEAFGYEMG